MRAGLLAAVLLVVAAVSALNLLVGAFWVVALVAVTLLRRRFPLAAWLGLLLALGIGAGAGRLGWLTSPRPASYTRDEIARLTERVTGLGALAGLGASPASAALADAAAGVRTRLAARRSEELRHPARQLEQRAVTAIAVSRDVGRLRSRAPAEVTALEEAVRRLALTLTAPEFRDLDTREARLIAWLVDLDARLGVARDQADLDAIARALEPAAMAPVSLRALREDLAGVVAASAALVRTLTGGGGVGVAATMRYTYDESRGLLAEEHRLVFEAAPSLRITRLDITGLREAPGPALAAQTLAFGVDGSELRAVLGGTDLALSAAGGTRVEVLDRRERPMAGLPIRTALRPIRFRRLSLPEDESPAPDFPVRVRLGDAPGPEPLLVVESPSPRWEGLALPAHAFHYATRPGTVTTGTGGTGGDLWVPGPARRPERLEVEIVPPLPLLRTAAFARLRPYLYAPNLAVALGGFVLAALTSVILRPRLRPPPPAPPVAAAPGAR